LRAVLVGNLIKRAFERGTSGGESTSCDIVLEEFLVDNIDDGGDESLDVFCASDESFNITYKGRLLVSFEEGIKFALNCEAGVESWDVCAWGNVRLEKSRNE
jgi:hypothetical protein